MIKHLLIGSLALFVTQFAQAEITPIKGAFGINLGETPRDDYRSGEVPTKIGKLFFIKPPIKNENFNEYAVMVTIRTNKIFRIYAEKEQTTASCNEKIIKVKKSLEKIYGTLTEANKVYAVKQKNKEIYLTCKVSKINNKEASLQIKYVDRKVYEDSLEKTDKNYNDASGL